jgi:hypothetical protein
LGSNYDVNGPLSFGREHRSSSVAVTWTYNLGGGRALMLDGLIAKTSGAVVNTGLVASVSPTVERAFGASFIQADAFRDGDRLSLWLAKPLRVISGSATVLTTTVDDQGLPVSSLVTASLKPDGDETDVGVGYSLVLKDGGRLTTAMALQSEAYNVRGLNDIMARVSYSKSF